MMRDGGAPLSYDVGKVNCRYTSGEEEAILLLVKVIAKAKSAFSANAGLSHLCCLSLCRKEEIDSQGLYTPTILKSRPIRFLTQSAEQMERKPHWRYCQFSIH